MVVGSIKRVKPQLFLSINSSIFRYAEVIKALLAPDFHYMISATQYTPHEGFSGPPRNVPTALVEKLFGESHLFSISVN